MNIRKTMDNTMERQFKLQNLSVGKCLFPNIREQLEKVEIGPFSIRFEVDYEDKHAFLTNQAHLKSSIQFTKGKIEVEEVIIDRDWFANI